MNHFTITLRTVPPPRPPTRGQFPLSARLRTHTPPGTLRVWHRDPRISADLRGFVNWLVHQTNQSAIMEADNPNICLHISAPLWWDQVCWTWNGHPPTEDDKG